MNSPRVTVLMSVYNGMPYLRESVNSILKQSFENFTFLIIDDGSTDQSVRFLEKIKDERIRIIKQENQGLGAALNSGLELVKTDFLARMDADDIAHANRLKLQVEKMKSDHELVMLGTGITFTVDGERYGFAPPMPQKDHQIRSVLLKGGHAISHPTIMCRTHAVRKIGGYRIDGVGQDWDFFLRMSEVGKLENLEETLLLYRLHKTSNAWGHSDKVIRGKGYAIACAKARLGGMEEPSMNEFIDQWNNKSIGQKILRNLVKVSDDAYRYGIVEYLKGNKTKGILSHLLSALLNPKKVMLYIIRKFFY